MTGNTSNSVIELETTQHLLDLSECELALVLQWIRILNLIKIETVSKKLQQVINVEATKVNQHRRTWIER